MSNRDVPKVCLVVDASVAHAAGGFEARHPLGTIRRDVLHRLRGISHRVAWGARLKAEWMEHQSNFAATWLAGMMSLGKLVPLDDTPDEAHLAVIEAIQDSGVAAALAKDAHLLAAALRSDRRILSLDDRMRGHFARAFRDDEAVMAVVWVNPAHEEEEAVSWLQEGAPPQDRRTLARVPD